MSDLSASSAKRLADAVSKAGKRGLPAAGAVLGVVVRGTPTLDVELDTGQIVPQCAGPTGLEPGVRVLCHWIQGGHNLAIQPMGGYLYSMVGAIFGADGTTTLHGKAAAGIPESTLQPTGLFTGLDGYWLITSSSPDPDIGYYVSCYYNGGTVNYQMKGAGSFHRVLPADAKVWAHDIDTGGGILLTIDWRAPHLPPDQIG